MRWREMLDAENDIEATFLNVCQRITPHHKFTVRIFVESFLTGVATLLGGLAYS